MDSKKFVKGDLISFTTWAKVTNNAHGSQLVVLDLDTKEPISMHGNEVFNRIHYCDHFEKTEKLSRTDVCRILVRSFNIPFKVAFIKENGEERTLRGRLVHTDEDLMGRSMAEDLDIDSGHRLRQIDHRTLKWLIVNGVKYVVKK